MKNIDELFIKWQNAERQVKQTVKDNRARLDKVRSEGIDRLNAVQSEAKLAYGQLLAEFGDAEVLDGIERMPFATDKKNSYEVRLTDTPKAILDKYGDIEYLSELLVEKTTKSISNTLIKQKLASGEWQTVNGKTIDANGEIIPFIETHLKKDDFRITQGAMK